MKPKPTNHVFFLWQIPLWRVVRMTMRDSVRDLKTCLYVFPGTLALFTHPRYSQKQLFGIPGYALYCDLVRRPATKKNDWFHLKKNVAIW